MDKEEKQIGLTSTVKYLFGRVHVETVEVTVDEGTSKEKAFEEAKKIFDEQTQSTELIKGYSRYFIGWGEGGPLNTDISRQGVLTAFLGLMDQGIPKTPSEEPRIIVPGGFGEYDKTGQPKKLPSI